MNTVEFSKDFKQEMQSIFNAATVKHGKEQALVLIRNKDTINGYTVPGLLATLIVRAYITGQLKTEDVDAVYNVIKYDADRNGQVRVVPVLSNPDRAIKIANDMMIDGDYKAVEHDNEDIIHSWVSLLGRVMIQKTVIE